MAQKNWHKSNKETNGASFANYLILKNWQCPTWGCWQMKKRNVCRWYPITTWHIIATDEFVQIYSPSTVDVFSNRGSQKYKMVLLSVSLKVFNPIFYCGHVRQWLDRYLKGTVPRYATPQFLPTKPTHLTKKRVVHFRCGNPILYMYCNKNKMSKECESYWVHTVFPRCSMQHPKGYTRSKKKDLYIRYFCSSVRAFHVLNFHFLPQPYSQ